MTRDDVYDRVRSVWQYTADPEAWHSHRDDLYADVLAAVADGNQDAQGLARAALTVETRTPDWHACA